MPGFGESVLTDEPIWAVLAYIKSKWPATIQCATEQLQQGSFEVINRAAAQ